MKKGEEPMDDGDSGWELSTTGGGKGSHDQGGAQLSYKKGKKNQPFDMINESENT